MSIKACLFIQASFGAWFPRLTAATRINKRRTEFAFLYCSSVWGPFAILEASFASEFTLHIVDKTFPVLSLFVCKPFT